MLRRNLNAATNELEQIRRLLAVSNRDRAFEIPYSIEECWPEVEAVDHTYWRAFEHCATVIRAYAAYENFVVASVERWIEWCLAHRPDLILKNENARGAYERGLAEILRRKTEARFSDLDRGKLAIGLSVFYTGSLPTNFVFSSDPFFAALPNLRLKTIIGLFDSLGLESFSAWLSSSKELRDFCIEEGYSLDEELSQFVERRNEAAHGNGIPSEILGANELTARIKLLSLMCDSIYQFVITAVCKAELGLEFEGGHVGTVTRVWRKQSAFELTMASTVLYSGTEVLMGAEGSIVRSVVCSLQLENESSLGFEVPIGTALGVRMSYIPAVGMRMIRLNGVRGIDALMAATP
jgi:hypothetical protein